MATTSLWSVKQRIDHVVKYATNKLKTKNNNFGDLKVTFDYATNPDKTEKQFFVTGINCDANSTVNEMIDVKKKYNKLGGILAFHGYQSFCEGEVTAEMAHEIGVRLAEEMWGDRFQVVVSTHLNTNHIHNHFVLNSVSFKDGKKYYSNLENTALFRKTSDDICEEFGLKVLGEKACKSGINFENFYKKSLANSDYYIFAKEDLDYAIKHSYTTKEFHKILSSMGYYYYYRAGKLTIRKEPHKRNIRVERAFGEEYSIDRIEEKIYNHPIGKEKNVVWVKSLEGRYYSQSGKAKNKPKAKGIIALYYHYCYLLKVFPKKNLQYKLSPKIRAEVRKMKMYSEKIRFLCKYKISNFADIENVRKVKQKDLRNCLNERNRLYYKRKSLSSDAEKEKMTEDIIRVTDKIKKIRKEIRFCEEIEKRVPVMRSDIRKFEEKNGKKQEDKDMKKERRGKERY